MTKKIYKYYRVSYSKENDSYSTWVYVGENKHPEWNEFGLEIECRCVKGEIDGFKSKENDFVSYHILTSIRNAMKLGYKVSFMDRPE
jgi:hypothetical protein